MNLDSLSMYLNSRGLVHVVQLPSDHPAYGNPRDLKGQEVMIDGQCFIVKGVETFVVPEGHPALKHPSGLLVEPCHEC